MKKKYKILRTHQRLHYQFKLCAKGYITGTTFSEVDHILCFNKNTREKQLENAVFT